MQIPLEGGALEALSSAIGSACLRDLPAIHDAHDLLVARDVASTLGKGRPTFSAAPGTRPTPAACEVAMFLQQWPGRWLGYGNQQGASGLPTRAYTVIVHCPAAACRAVYFGVSGRLAYLIPDAVAPEAFDACVAQQRMPDVSQAAVLGWHCATNPLPY